MISSITLKSGRSPNATGLSVAATPVTVFVGPNNSGKSKVLAEIAQFCRSGTEDSAAVVLDNLTFEGMSEDAARQAIAGITQPPNPGERVLSGHIFVGALHGGRHHVSYETLLGAVRQPSSNLRLYGMWFLTYKTLILDGPNRIAHIREQNAGDLQHPAQTSFQVLFREDEKRREVRRIVFEAFGDYFVIDPTHIGHLRIRLSPRAPVNDIEERGIHAEAAQFHAQAKSIDQASDGVKAFTGIITELVAGDPNILLVDEPEAFLHPSLASKLGNEVSRAAVNAHKRVLVATHSPAFVMGCIQSGAPINIIRLTYRAGVATARVLPSQDILKLMRNPLLRSTGVLSGLFYEFVIVTESDSDRAFYQEINERLLRFKPEWGIPNCLFLNAQNKQTVHTILRPLRELGIPAVGIVDVDIFKEGGSPWTSLLSSANVPTISHSSLATMRSAIKAAMDVTGKDMKREGGISILKPSDQEAADTLLSQLQDYGVFVVPGGELESWLKFLSVPSHGSNWLVGMFEKMGDDPDDAGYVKPISGDVWKFLSEVRAWLVDTNRKGIPA